MHPLLKHTGSKILLFICLTTILVGCSVHKSIDDERYLLNENIIIYNGERTNVDSLRRLISQKPNNKLLGIPLKLMLYQAANPNINNDFDQWLQKAQTTPYIHWIPGSAWGGSLGSTD